MEGKTPDVSVLVVAYNSRDVISRCIDAIRLAARTTTIEVLLVDNGTDGTERLVEEQYPEVRIIPGIGNVGFARGNNLLAVHARGEFLLLINPDLYAAPGAIDALVEGARNHPEAGAWGGVTTDLADVPDTGNAISIPSLAELASAAVGLSRAGKVKPQVDRDVPVEVLSGGFVMLSRRAWDRVAGFDERFFLYCEEVDLFRRMRLLGYELWRIAKARGAHELAHGNNLTARRLLFRTAGTMEFVRKHWSLPLAVIGMVLIWAGAVARYAAGRLLGSRKPGLARLGEAYRLVALRPQLWMHGYDPAKGLTARLPLAGAVS